MNRLFRLSRAQGRALRRLAELSRLAAWRAQHGVPLVDPCGFALSVADALAVSPRPLDYPAFVEAVGAVVPENVALQALRLFPRKSRDLVCVVSREGNRP